jgi:hypothetical protein
MRLIKGYAVVEKKSSASKKSRNLRYQGLDRTVPWSQEKHDAGWNDPMMRGYMDTNGLIPGLEEAREALRIYAEVEPAADLEILYGSICEETSFIDERQPGTVFLGFDVAGRRSPFWSIVGDFGPEPPIQRFLSKLNENGLFASIDDAKSFLDTYQAEKLPDYDFPLVVWALWLVA